MAIEPLMRIPSANAPAKADIDPAIVRAINGALMLEHPIASAIPLDSPLPNSPSYRLLYHALRIITDALTDEDIAAERMTMRKAYAEHIAGRNAAGAAEDAYQLTGNRERKAATAAIDISSLDI